MPAINSTLDVRFRRVGFVGFSALKLRLHAEYRFQKNAVVENTPKRCAVSSGRFRRVFNTKSLSICGLPDVEMIQETAVINNIPYPAHERHPKCAYQ